MFGLPAATPFDLNFRLLGIPVRVSPWFWLVSAMMVGTKANPATIVTWVGCVFASILLHEFGHGLFEKQFGHHPEIALYGMGGLCTSGANHQTLRERLIVLFGGPGIQFVLLGVVMIVGAATLGITWRGDLVLAKLLLGITPSSLKDLQGAQEVMQAQASRSENAWRVYFYLFQINLLWPLLNLLPIYPLDGGQITKAVWSRVDRRNGARRTHILSVLTAGIMAALAINGLSQDRDGGALFRVLFFGSFAFLNYQLLQAYHYQATEYGSDDADWWKR